MDLDLKVYVSESESRDISRAIRKFQNVYFSGICSRAVNHRHPGHDSAPSLEARFSVSRFGGQRPATAGLDRSEASPRVRRQALRGVGAGVPWLHVQSATVDHSMIVVVRSACWLRQPRDAREDWIKFQDGSGAYGHHRFHGHTRAGAKIYP
jgi:hypothetical protein